jgi:hypothetical protein
MAKKYQVGTDAVALRYVDNLEQHFSPWWRIDHRTTTWTKHKNIVSNLKHEN